MVRDVHERTRDVGDEVTPARACGAKDAIHRCASVPTDASMCGEPAIERARGAVVERVGEGQVGLRELEAVAGEIERRERRRPGRERNDGRANVVAEPGERELFGADAAPEPICPFQKQDRTPLDGEDRGGGEPVGPRPDHDGVIGGLAHPWLRRRIEGCAAEGIGEGIGGQSGPFTAKMTRWDGSGRGRRAGPPTRRGTWRRAVHGPIGLDGRYGLGLRSGHRARPAYGHRTAPPIAGGAFGRARAVPTPQEELHAHFYELARASLLEAFARRLGRGRRGRCDRCRLQPDRVRLGPRPEQPPVPRLHPQDRVGRQLRGGEPEREVPRRLPVLPLTWDATARHAGWTWLVGTDPAAAAPWDQDAMALHLYQWQGASPWLGRCAGK